MQVSGLYKNVFKSRDGENNPAFVLVDDRNKQTTVYLHIGRGVQQLIRYIYYFVRVGM